jgi:probable HAF family extracellular repeat protein
MASFNRARVLFLTFGALCSGACSGATPGEGAGKSAADSSIASVPVAATCPPSHEHFTDLGDLDPENELGTTFPSAINDQGTIVGSGTVYLPRERGHAFRWKADTGLVDLGVNVGSGSYASDVNEQDEVVGSEIVMDSGMVVGWNHAVLWDAQNGVHELGSLGGPDSHAVAINNRGQVVGMAQDASGMEHSFIWEAKTGMVALDLPQGAEASDINDSGVVVGTIHSGVVVDGIPTPTVIRPFKWTKEGGPMDLDLLDGTQGFAYGINNEGEIVGDLMIDDEWVGVKWTACGAQRLPSTPGALGSSAYAINDQGLIVGNTQLPTSNTQPSTNQASEWDPMLRARLLPLQAVESGAADVNDCGDVVGYRLVKACPVRGRCPSYRAVLWQPERPAP